MTASGASVRTTTVNSSASRTTFSIRGTWNEEVCYLQDLFVDPALRGRGVARALIEAVAKAALERGAERLYWLTQEHNAAARALYDKVAKYNHFIRYDYPLHLAVV